jgi:hypothetical protein
MRLGFVSQNRAAALGFLGAVTFSLFMPQNLCGGVAPQCVTIGNGSGHLRFPDAQTTLKLRPGDTLYINPGTYLGLSLGNLCGSAAAPITVVCDSNTVFTTSTPQPNNFPNIAHLRFQGFRYENYNSTCMRITGQSHDLLFKDFYKDAATGRVNYITKDRYNQNRYEGAAADVGAVERQEGAK